MKHLLGKRETRVQRVGLDIGSRRVRIVKAERAADGPVRVLSILCRDIPEGGLTARDIKALAKEAGVAAMSISCNLGPKPVIVHEMDLPRMAEEELAGAIRIEAEQIITDIDKMVLGYQVLGTKRDPERPGETLHILVAAAHREDVDERANLLFSTGLDIRALVPDGLALANALVVVGRDGEKSALGLDMGLDGTTLVAVGCNGHLSAPIVRHVPGGRRLLLERSDGAEQNAQRQRWLLEVERTLEFVTARFATQLPNILLTGEGAQMPEAMHWLSENASATVRPWNSLKGLSCGPKSPSEDEVETLGVHCAVALGLALTEGD